MKKAYLFVVLALAALTSSATCGCAAPADEGTDAETGEASEGALNHEKQTTRFLVWNHTGRDVQLSVWVNGAWRSRGSISVNASLPVYNVKNDERFRAQWRGGESAHTVKLRYDRAYGAEQDTWMLPE